MSNLQDDTPLDEHPQSKTHASALQISPEANPVFDQGPPTNDSQLLSNLTHLSSLPQSQSWGPEPSNLRVRNTRKAISPFKVTPAILPSQQPHPSSIPRPSPSPVSTMPTSDQKDPVDPSLLALVPSNNLSRPPETGNDEQIDAEQRDVAAEKLTNIDSDHANLPDIGFKRVREHSESGNDLKDFPVKRRTRKHSNKPPQRLSAQVIFVIQWMKLSSLRNLFAPHLSQCIYDHFCLLLYPDSISYLMCFLQEGMLRLLSQK